jgi:hypothetical protein
LGLARTEHSQRVVAVLLRTESNHAANPDVQAESTPCLAYRKH